MSRCRALLISALVGLTSISLSWAADLPGKGVTLRPIKGTPENSWFQTLVVQIGLKKLGYSFDETKIADFPAMFLAVGSGDADYTVNAWKPLHDAFYERSGGDDAMVRRHVIIKGADQGYYIDRRAAEAHHITDFVQLKEPQIAKLFDSDSDGKANLAGCNPGWGCEIAIARHLKEFDLTGTVQQDEGSYFALMADVITRYKNGSPILYYTWSPNWISTVLVPGRDVVQLRFPANPQAHTDSSGFTPNDVYVVANRDFMSKNLAAAKFLDLVEIPVDAVNQAQLALRDAKNSPSQLRKQAEDYVAAHRAEFDKWDREAAAAAK